MLDTTPDQIAEKMIQMIQIEDKVLIEFLSDLSEVDQLTLDVLFGRLQTNSMMLGNLALMIRNEAMKAIQEMAETEKKLHDVS